MALQLQIEKLKGFENYKHWSITLRAYLETEDLWNVIEFGSTNTKESQFKDSRVKFIILCLIEANVFRFVNPYVATASGLWDELKAVYES